MLRNSHSDKNIARLAFKQGSSFSLLSEWNANGHPTFVVSTFGRHERVARVVPSNEDRRREVALRYVDRLDVGERRRDDGHVLRDGLSGGLRSGLCR